MWKKNLIFPYSLNCLWQMITRKKIPSIGESVRKYSEVQVFLHVQKNQFYVYLFNYCTELWRPGRARPPSPDNVPPLPPPLPWFSYLYQHWQPIYQTNDIIPLCKLFSCCETKPSQLSPSYLGVWYNNHIHNSLLETIMKYFWKTHLSGCLHFSGYIITSPLYLTTYLFSLLAIINLISLKCVYFKTNQ